jgi:predicted nucleic acid-binding protein
LEKETKRTLDRVNSVLRSTNTGEKITILHLGEASCLAFSKLCKEENLIVVDERTTRMLAEAPKNLEALMEKKMHMPLDARLDLLQDIREQKFIRSAELLYLAYKKNILPIKKTKDALDAMLYGVKFKGTAISSSEIEEIKRLAG